MDDDVATTSSARSSAANLLLMLALSPAASKVIAKGGKRVVQQLAAVDGAFQCRTCDRRFATFQALGGHRTSHKRPRVRAHGLDLLLGARPGKGGGGVAGRAVHRCGTCGKVFATGQALGGHMRRHRPPVVGSVASTWTEATAMSSGFGVCDQDDDDAGLLHRTLIKFI